ncbi:hypothetical protein M885DRAFT_547989 [Pelagophyceae sp. CCMP2097]|nr:hypothetical protein M885DRAFT_547989 [Pelagophyceae sp. CCMP2097]
MKIGDILSAVEESAPDYLEHYFEVTMQKTTTRSIDYVMGVDTIKVEADFTAQVEHNHDDNLTCCKPNHSNCEVVVVHLNPRMLAGKDGVHRRVVDVHVWYGIGPTASKHKEADSHFHNAYLAHIIDYYKANLYKFVDAPGAELKSVFYKGRFNFKYLAEYAKDFGVKVMHIFPPTAHGKGYVDALGQTPGRLLNHEERMKRRMETAYELFKLVRGKRGGVVPESERGKGRFAVHGYYVNYLTSDPEDPHLEDDDVIYIDRSTKWNVCGLPGSNEMHFFASANLRLDPTDDEHILAKPFFCVCEACRVTEFHKCKATEWTGHHTTHSIRYTDTPRATFKRAEVLGAFTAFANSASDGDALVFALEEDDGHPYGIAIADGPPFKAEKALKTAADGVSQKIITGEWCARIKFWLRRDAEDPLKFTRAVVLDNSGRIAATVFSFENMQLTPKGPLRCDSPGFPDVNYLSEADHDALLQKNWSRFQRRF